MKFNDISVIILLYKTPKKLLKNLLNYKNFKILIFDQSYDLKTKKILQNLLPKIEYYGLSKKNYGFAKAQNFLIKKVKTKYFFSTQADINIKESSILKLKKLLIKDNKNLISVPNINKVYKVKKKTSLVLENFIGAAFMANKIDFKKFGMFDENFFFYWEDVDLSYRISNSKYSIILSLNAKASHKSGNSSYKNLKSIFIRKVNFRFGEYLFLYKTKKLRILKILRETSLNLIKSLLNLLFFRYNQSISNLFNLFGILKFLIFLINKTLK